MESLLSMQSEAKVKPLRFKRSIQYLAEEGGPSDTDSRYDASAGLPPSHKRVRVGEYKDPAYAGPSTSALDEELPIDTSTPLTSMYSEIPEDESVSIAGNPRSVYPQGGPHPHWEAPKAMAPFSRHFAPSKNPKADYRRTSPISTKSPAQATRDGLADKSRKLVETASIKKQHRERIIASKQAVNTGERLLQDIISTGRHDDPLSEWFGRLRIPCHRERVARVSRAIPPSEAAMGIPLAKRTAIAPAPVDNAVEYLDGEGEGSSIESKGATSCPPKSLQSKSNASASDLTQDQLHKHLAWEFPTSKAVDKPPSPNTLAVLYVDPFPVGETMKAIHDITCPVGLTPRPNQKPRMLDRRIDHHLRREEYHFSLGWKLRLPNIWKEIRDQKIPWSYTIPDQYTPFVYNKAADVPIRDEQSYSEPSLSSGSTDSDENVVRWAPPPQTPAMPTPTLESKVEISPDDPLGMEILQYNYNFKDSDPLRKKVEIANALAKEIQTITAPYMRHHYIVALYERIDAMRITSPLIEHLEESEIKGEDKDYGYGDPTYNWATNSHLQFEPYIIEKFLAFPGVSKECPSEGRVEAIVGSLLQGIVAGPGLMDRDQMSAPFPKHLCPVGTGPSPDKYARADKESLEWPEKLLPVLFGAECKPVKTYSVWHTRAQLAAAFHGTLVTLILYYLDTRHSRDSALPAWLFLYGIEYTEKGVFIHAHHPAYFIDEKDPEKSHWILKAKIVSTNYGAAFLSGSPPRLRLQLLAALFRIRSHCLRVLNLLKRWKRAPQILRILSSPEVIKWSSNVSHVEEDSNGSVAPPPV